MIFSKLVSRLALASRIALFGTAAICLAWSAHVVTQRLVQFSSSAAALLVGVPLLVAAFAAYVALRFDDNSVRRIVREMFFLGVSLLAVETLVAYWAPDRADSQLTRAMFAHRLGLPFDTRTKSQVVAALQSKGTDVLPGISREWPRLSGVRQQLPENFFPLSHASNTQIVECNEGGEYVLFATDEFGLNNPRGLLLSKRIDAAVLGSSFALGHCVPPDKSFVAVLRSSFPRIANFGMAGSGVLSSLATFREYVEPLKPPVVIWIVNALMVDTHEEFADPILSQYMRPTYSQHLATRQELIDRTWRELAVSAQFEFDRKSKVVSNRADSNRFDGIPYLYNLRHRMKVDRFPIAQRHAPDLAPFLACLDLAKQTVERWGGTFVVVIEPLYAEAVAGELDEALRHDHLATAIERSGISVIDAVDAIRPISDRQGLYTLRSDNHLNAKGTAIVGAFVTAQLKTLVHRHSADSASEDR